MADRPLSKLRAILGARSPKREILVVVQTTHGQVTVPADVLRDRLKTR
jgi:hypothetical protein